MEFIAHAFISNSLSRLRKHRLSYQLVLNLSNLFIHQHNEAPMSAHLEWEKSDLDYILSSFFQTKEFMLTEEGLRRRRSACWREGST